MVSRLVGYARVSTDEQDLGLQISALESVGVRRPDIFTDIASGAKSQRPGLGRLFKHLKYGDTLVVWRIDRLGRSLIHLVETVEKLRTMGVSFRSLCDGGIDTTTASGELVFHIFSSLAQFERRLIQERTNAGLAAARKRGSVCGRKPIAANDPKVKAVIAMISKGQGIIEIMRVLKISRATFYRYCNISKNNLV